jgi:hypothetical protein
MAETLNINIAVLDKATGPLNKVSSGVSQFGKRVEQTSKIQNQFGTVADKNTTRMSRFAKSGLQQTGYQLGDFAVQVGGGTSALQAFGQQGSQLLGIFGATGALLGAGVAIVAALGNAYMKSGAMVKTFSEEVDDLNSLVSESHALGRTSSEQFAFLATKYGEVTEGVKGLFKAEKSLLQLKLTETFVKVRKGLRPFREELAKANLVSREGAYLGAALGGTLEALSGSFEELENSTGMTKKQLEAFASAMPELMSMQDAKESIEFVNKLLEDTGLNGVKGMEGLTDAGRENVRMLLQYAQAGQVVNVTMQELDKTVSSVEMATAGLGKTFGLTLEAGDNLAQSIASSMGQSFTSIVKGTQSVNKAFQNMAASIIDQLFQVLIVQRLVGAVGTANTAGTGIAGFLTRATGGPVSKGQTYLVGERGPELFTPSSSGQVIPNNKMGGGVSVVNNLTVNSDNASAVRSEVLSMLPMIKEASKSAVLEASRRGGSYANSFGN